MKQKQKKKYQQMGRVVAASITALAALLLYTPSYALPPGVGVKKCTVSDSHDGVAGRRSVTLRHALYYASKTNNNEHFCRDEIIIASDVNLTKPLVINPNHNNGHYSIVGKKDGGSGRIKLDASGMSRSGESNCAVIFKNTDSITFKNISIKNVPAGFHAICVEGTASGIKLDDILIKSVDRGDGIVIMDGSSENVIQANCILDTIHGDGISIRTSSEVAHNKIVGTSREYADSDRYTSGDGTVVFADPTEVSDDLVLRGIDGEQIQYTNGPYKLLVSKMSNSQGKIQIDGALVKTDSGDDDSEVCVPQEIELINQSKLVPSLQALQVYAIGVKQQGSAGGNRSMFLTYVTSKENCVDTSNCTFGTFTGNDSTNTYNQNGIFKFKLDENDLVVRLNKVIETRYPDEQPVTGIDQIILVPELDNGSVASASKIITLRRGNTNDIVGPFCSEDDGGGDGNNGGGTGGGGYLLNGYKTVQQCDLARSGNQLAPENFDSDGDGIKDNIEDPLGDCSAGCEQDGKHFSCWNDPDSDNDGVLDGAEKLGNINIERVSTGSGAYCESGTVYNVNVADVCDIDGDGVSNAFDTDSDDDGLPDYREDRFRTFAIGRTAHYYDRNAIGQPRLEGANGDLTCESYLDRTGSRDVGKAAGIFRVKKNNSGKAVSVDTYDWSGLNSGEEIMLLECRNDSISNTTNLNGAYEDNSDASHLYAKDTTPGDGKLDGECQGRFDAATSRCELGCRDYEIFQGMAEEDVVMSGGRAIGLKKDANDVPTIFQKSWNDIRCSDIDTDGIPDCVENPEGTCSPCNSPDNLQKKLCPYKKDSDNDGLVDGKASTGETPDKCPFTRGESCNQRLDVYDQVPVLAFFLDRDGDSITDGQEECPSERVASSSGSASEESASGSIFRFFGSGARAQTVGSSSCEPDGEPNYATGMEGRLITATDPLNPDTDNDGVGDYIEVVTWNRHTNPADANTDADGLPDGLEVKDYARPVPTEYPSQTGLGCTQFTRVDPGADISALATDAITDSSKRLGTNPANPDTDGDGVQDGVEVRGSYNGDIANLLSGAFPAAGFDLVSNPLALDSDGDTIKDGDEYGTDGIVQYRDSNPCALDTDGDRASDVSEQTNGCSTSALPNAKCPRSEEGTGGGTESDGDTLSDTCEASLGTSATELDSDNDGLNDNEEDVNANCKRDAGETDALNPDSDGDHLSDGLEIKLLHMSAVGALTNEYDGDGITDDKEMGLIDVASLQAASSEVTIYRADGSSTQASVVLNRSYTPGRDTDPTNPDTDADGLCDGNTSVSNGGPAGNVTCIRGEDINANGFIDRDLNNPNLMLETDPRNADSDNDGENDQSEVCHGGSCNIAANVGRATQGASSGCFSVSGATPTDPSSMLYVFGLLVMINRLMAVRVRRKILPFVRGGRVG